MYSFLNTQPTKNQTNLKRLVSFSKVFFRMLSERNVLLAQPPAILIYCLGVGNEAKTRLKKSFLTQIDNSDL